MSMGVIRTAPMSVPFNMHVGREGFNPPCSWRTDSFLAGSGSGGWKGVSERLCWEGDRNQASPACPEIDAVGSRIPAVPVSQGGPLGRRPRHARPRGCGGARRQGGRPGRGGDRAPRGGLARRRPDGHGAHQRRRHPVDGGGYPGGGNRGRRVRRHADGAEGHRPRGDYPRIPPARRPGARPGDLDAHRFGSTDRDRPRAGLRQLPSPGPIPVSRRSISAPATSGPAWAPALSRSGTVSGMPAAGTPSRP